MVGLCSAALSVPNTPPLVIYGTGGSGTRVLVRIARHLGYFMGNDLNGSEDSMPLFRFYEQWVAQYLADIPWLRAALEGSSVPLDAPAEMVTGLQAAVDEHTRGLLSADAPWGWKNPRALLILPVIHHVAPRFLSIHLIRDGRDMAVTDQMSVLRWDVESALGMEGAARWTRPERQAALWSHLNLAAANFARDQLGPDGLIIRFEDLCESPRPTVEQIADFLDARPSGAEVDAAVAEIQPPATIGRWQQYDLSKVLPMLRPGLDRFGYTSQGEHVREPRDHR